MKYRAIRITAALCLYVGVSFESGAQEYYPAGTGTREAATASALRCDGPHCMVYNPAQMEDSGLRPSLDVGFVRAKQTYEHPSFDPVSIEITSPLVSFGLTHAIASTPITYGIVVIPQSYGEQKIDGLPRRIAGEFENIYVKNKSVAYDLALGARYAVAPSFALGLTVNRRHESRNIYAHRIGDEAVLFRYSGHNTFYVPTVGATWTLAESLKFGLSYRFARRKAYKGRQKSAVSDDITPPKNRSYDPAVAMASATTYPFEQLSVTLNYNRYFYESGKGYVCECLTNNVSRADLRDIDERSLNMTYALLTNFAVTGSYGVIPSPWGAGNYSDVVDDHSIGTDIGTANNISRKAYAIGAKGSLNTLSWTASYLHSYGKREVGPQGDKPGFYQTEVRTVSASIAHSF